MEKKHFIAPELEVVKFEEESMMFCACSGMVGGENQPGTSPYCGNYTCTSDGCPMDFIFH